MTDWVELITTYDETEAHMMKDILEAENIEVAVRSMKISPYPVSFGRLGEVKLLVRAENIDHAKRVLRIMSDSEGDPGE